MRQSKKSEEAACLPPIFFPTANSFTHQSLADFQLSSSTDAVLAECKPSPWQLFCLGLALCARGVPRSHFKWCIVRPYGGQPGLWGIDQRKADAWQGNQPTCTQQEFETIKKIVS